MAGLPRAKSWCTDPVGSAEERNEMSMFRIPAYDTTVIGDGFIDVSVRDWQPLSIRAYILMRKSLALADRLEKRDPRGIEPKHRRKAAAKLKQAGATRWITIQVVGGADVSCFNGAEA